MSERQTDRQTKSSRWQFTAYKDQWSLFETMPPGIAEWGWQREICPDTNREHYQGYLRLAQQQRFAWLAKNLPGVHVEVARNWQALIAYSKKEDTRAPGSTPEHHTNSIPNHYQYADDVGKRVCEHMLRENMDFVKTPLENYLTMIDMVVKDDVASGKRYAAHIGANPAWLAMWKKYAKQFIFSFIGINATTREEGCPQAQGREGEGSQDSHSQVSS